LSFVAMLASVAALTACGEDGGDGEEGATSEAIEHVHGLGVNPADGSLFIATHSGLFRTSDDSTEIERVGASTQDTMGFTVVGPDRFLGSGHPGPGEEGPPSLGLIESTDAGQSWEGVSLGGEADFHVLRHAHDRVYAVNALTGLLMLSDDGGETWLERRPPAPVIDLAVDPGDPRRIIASTEAGLAVSENDGRSWRPLSDAVGLASWPEAKRLYLIDANGEVQLSRNGGGAWDAVGQIGGQPAAMAAADGRTLYAALADGRLVESTDGGESWQPRS
jgi:photosystem II stability/assembly factor-like uncharacterized protein